jgi:hypothetical protein
MDRYDYGRHLSRHDRSYYRVVRRSDAARGDGRCAKAPGFSPPAEAIERGLPIGVQVILCPQSKRWGFAEVFVYKTIIGLESAYQMQRSWRSPPVADAQSLAAATPREQVQQGHAYLRTAGVCDNRRPERACANQ